MGIPVLGSYFSNSSFPLQHKAHRSISAAEHLIEGQTDVCYKKSHERSGCTPSTAEVFYKFRLSHRAVHPLSGS